MKPIIRLVEMSEETSYTPLGVLGYCLTRTAFLAPLWEGVQWPMKRIDHTPAEKLQDILVSILAGCRAISQVNTRLRPDVALARAWGRERFAEQSALARTLDAFDKDRINQLYTGNKQLFQRESGVFRHPFDRDMLWLDIDLTPLPASKRAEGSTKGRFPKKTATVASWDVFMLRSIMKRSSHRSIQGNKTVDRAIFPFWRAWKRCSISPPPKNKEP